MAQKTPKCRSLYNKVVNVFWHFPSLGHSFCLVGQTRLRVGSIPHPFWDWTRARVCEFFAHVERTQGFFPWTGLIHNTRSCWTLLSVPLFRWGPSSRAFWCFMWTFFSVILTSVPDKGRTVKPADGPINKHNSCTSPLEMWLDLGNNARCLSLGEIVTVVSLIWAKWYDFKLFKFDDFCEECRSFNLFAEFSELSAHPSICILWDK